MSKGDRIYYNIQEVGKKNVQVKSEKILRELAPILGVVNFSDTIDSINKLYILLENGCYPWMEPILKKYGYDLGAELQHLIANITYGEQTMGYDGIKNAVLRFPSLNSIHRGTYEYQLETKLGTIFIAPLTRYSKDSKIKSFVLRKNMHHFCHVSAEEFITLNPEYTAVTSLVANQFGEQHYHTYIETPDGYADLANNVHMSKENFEKVMRPVVLNKVNGHNLKKQARELDTDDLSSEKSLLLRLAVHQQVKNR